MKQKIAPYLRHLLSLADAGKIECMIVVDVQLDSTGQPVPTVGAFAEDVSTNSAVCMTQHMAAIGQELRAGLATGGGQYPPPAEPYVPRNKGCFERLY